MNHPGFPPLGPRLGRPQHSTNGVPGKPGAVYGPVRRLAASSAVWLTVGRKAAGSIEQNNPEALSGFLLSASGGCAIFSLIFGYLTTLRY